jgi:hypothetical protein
LGKKISDISSNEPDVFLSSAEDTALPLTVAVVAFDAVGLMGLLFG